MKTKIFFLTLSLFLFTSFQVHAASFVVTTVADIDDSNPGDGQCKNKGQLTKCSLRAAIMEANALKQQTSITFAPTATNQIHKLSQNNPLVVQYPLTITGNGKDLTTIDGNLKTRIFEINLTKPAGSDAETTFYMHGITLTNGNTTDLGGAIYNYNSDKLVIIDCAIGPNNKVTAPAYSDANPAPNFKPADVKNFAVGGAIYHHHGLLHIDNSVLINNSAGVFQTKAGYGGAIYLRDGLLQINNTQFQDNKAYKYGGGGALFVEGGTFLISGNSQFVNNQAGYGGAIYNKSLSTDTDNNPNNKLVAVTFSNNMANNGDGGAINNEGVVHITQSAFNDNKATKTGNAGIGRGGAIFQDTAAVLKFYKLNTVIEQSTFSKNKANNDGGAIYQRPGYIDIAQTTFSENSATNNGGAIWLGGGAYTSGTLTISESLFELNGTSYGSGGAIYTKSPKPTVRIYNSTISGNQAQFAGGIYAAADSNFNLYHVTLAYNSCTSANGCGIKHEHLGEFDLNHDKFVFNQSLIINNFNPNGAVAGPDCYGFFKSTGGNVIGDRSETSYKSGKYHCDIKNFDNNPAASDVDLKEKFVGKNIPVIDPLAQNGGPTKTHALPLGSPAINQGLPTADNQCLKADISFLDSQAGKVKYTKDQTTINQRNVGSHCDAGAFETQCGNGILDPGEECDDGKANSDGTPNACQKSCKQAYCGNQIIDNGEECDDGNGYSFDACTFDCKEQVDADADGYYNMFVTGSPFHDCDDNKDTGADIHPDAKEICGDGVDQNCDNADLSCNDVDNDGDGMTETQGDCDDNDAQVKKADNIPELCDDKDNNCDGVTDGEASEDAKTFYVDADVDGHGGEKTVKACSMPEGTLASSTDCDDTRADINPDIKEICDDEVDQNCDGQHLDCKDVDNDGDGMTETAGDCDDTNALVHPGEPEHCDKIDNTCNGEVDEGCESIVPKDGEDAPPFIPVGPIVDDLGGGDSGVDDTGNVDDSTGEEDIGESKDDDALGPTDAGDGDNADDGDTDAEADASEDENDGDGRNSNDEDAVGPNAVQEAQKGSGAPACSLNPGSADISLTLLLLVSFVMMIMRKRWQQRRCSPS